MQFSEQEIRDALKHSPEEAKVMIEANALLVERNHNRRSVAGPIYAVIVGGLLSVGANLIVSYNKATADLALEREKSEAKLIIASFDETDPGQTARNLTFLIEAKLLPVNKYAGIDELAERYNPKTNTPFSEELAAQRSTLLMLGSDKTLEEAEHHRDVVLKDPRVMILKNRARFRTALAFSSLEEAKAHLQTLPPNIRQKYLPYPVFLSDFCPHFPAQPDASGVFVCDLSQ